MDVRFPPRLFFSRSGTFSAFSLAIYMSLSFSFFFPVARPALSRDITCSSYRPPSHAQFVSPQRRSCEVTHLDDIVAVSRPSHSLFSLLAPRDRLWRVPPSPLCFPRYRAFFRLFLGDTVYTSVQTRKVLVPETFRADQRSPAPPGRFLPLA